MTDDTAERARPVGAPLTDLDGLLMRSRRAGDVHAIALFGDLDHAAAGSVTRELLRVEATGVRTIVLDLFGVTRMDAAGGRVVLQAQSRSRDCDRLTVRRGPVAARWILEQAGLEDLHTRAAAPKRRDAPSTVATARVLR